MSDATHPESVACTAAGVLTALDEHGEPLMTAEEREILQELMNIAFGQAAACLAEMVDLFIYLSVPSIEILQGKQVAYYLERVVGTEFDICMMEERFYGKLAGSAFLVFATGAGRQLVPLFGDVETLYDGGAREEVERDALLAAGGILIGACVGKLAELLNDQVMYSPAKVVSLPEGKAMPPGLCDPNNVTIVLKTDFSFRAESVQGFLFIVTSQESIGWLKQALADFLAQYEG